MLRQDASLARAAERPSARQTDLPARLSSFIGRHDELAELVSMLRAHRLLTVTGPGGTGKTTLALEVARRTAEEFRDGAWFVDLSGLTDPTGVADAIADALALPRTDPLPGESSASRLARRLAAHQALIVLDNCEHVIEACAEVSQRLLRTCADLRILATSRESLAIPGEGRFLLEPLATPPDDMTAEQVRSSPAVQLFVDRARAAVRGFVLDDGTAVDIAACVDSSTGFPWPSSWRRRVSRRCRSGRSSPASVTGSGC